MQFLSPEVALYLYKSTIRPYMEYCYHVQAGATRRYLELLDKLQKWIFRSVGPSFAATLEPLAHRQNIARISLFYRYYFGRCSFELVQMVPLPYSRGRSSRYSDRLHNFTGYHSKMLQGRLCQQFLSQHRQTLFQNSLPIVCFPLTYDLNGLESKINRNLLTIDSFKTDFLLVLLFLWFFFFNSMPQQLFSLAWSES